MLKNKLFCAFAIAFIMSATNCINSSSSKPEKNQSYVSVKDFGAIGDGETDDTQAIQKAIGSLPKEGGIVFFHPGHYLTKPFKGNLM